MIPPVCRCRSPANLRYRKLPPRNRLAGGQTFALLPRSPSFLLLSFPLFSRSSIVTFRFNLEFIPFRVTFENCISIFSIFFPNESRFRFKILFCEQTRIKSRARNLFFKFLIFDAMELVNEKYTRDRLHRLLCRLKEIFESREICKIRVITIGSFRIFEHPSIPSPNQFEWDLVRANVSYTRIKLEPLSRSTFTIP